LGTVTAEKRIAQAQCPAGGVHYWICSWPSEERYIGTCAKCGQVKELDATLGIGRMEFQRARRKGRFIEKTALDRLIEEELGPQRSG